MSGNVGNIRLSSLHGSATLKLNIWHGHAIIHVLRLQGYIPKT